MCLSVALRTLRRVLKRGNVTFEDQVGIFQEKFYVTKTNWTFKYVVNNVILQGFFCSNRRHFNFNILFVLTSLNENVFILINLTTVRLHLHHATTSLLATIRFYLY